MSATEPPPISSGLIAYAAWSLQRETNPYHLSRLRHRVRRRLEDPIDTTTGWPTMVVKAVIGARDVGVPASTLASALLLHQVGVAFDVLIPGEGSYPPVERAQRTACLLAGMTGAEIEDCASNGTWPDPVTLATLTALHRLPAEASR